MQKGQALVMLLVFMVVSITITSAAVTVILVNSLSATRIEQNISAMAVAESGAENALIRLARNPTYVGETLTVGSGTATVVVTGGNTKTITSTSKTGNFVSTTAVVITYPVGSDIFSITSWKETF